MSVLVCLTIFVIGLFIASACTYGFSNGMKDSSYGNSFWGFIVWGFSSRSFGFLLLALEGLLAMALPVLSLFHKNNMSTIVLVIISIGSLILTAVCSYVFIKGIRIPPYKNILFQWIIFILLGLYTMVLSVLKMIDITLWI